MLERTDAITNEVLEAITFVLAYATVLHVVSDIVQSKSTKAHVYNFFSRYTVFT